MLILCLHGYGQTSERFIEKYEKFWKFLRDAGCTPIAGNGQNAVINFSLEHGNAWFTIPGDDFFTSKRYLGLDKSIKYIDDLNKVHKFDGIIGYSQGATFATIIVGLGIIKPKFMMLFGGYPPTDSEFIDVARRINIPVLGVYGSADTVVNPELSITLYNMIPGCETHEYKGGHVIPCNLKFKEIYTKFINRIKIESDKN
jgi:predicted esterase